MEALISLVNTAIVHTHSKASNMMILFPRITTIPILFCCPLVGISTHSSITRFIKGSNPRNSPWTCLPPFNFNDNFLSINFFNSGGCALLMSTLQAQRSLQNLECFFRGHVGHAVWSHCQASFAPKRITGGTWQSLFQRPLS